MSFMHKNKFGSDEWLAQDPACGLPSDTNGHQPHLYYVNRSVLMLFEIIL